MELCGTFKCGTSTLFYVVYFLRSVMYVNGIEQYPTDHEKGLPEKVSQPDYLFFYQGVEGTPGIDFPVYSHIPSTKFSCKELESGYYADTDTDCQVFHICEDEKKISFLCPNGTIFQQTDLICEWWFKVNCSHSPYLYEESAENLRENVAKRKSFRRVHLNTQELDKSTLGVKENSFIDRVADNKYNTQHFSNTNNKNDRLVTTQNNNYNTHNLKPKNLQNNHQTNRAKVKSNNKNNVPKQIQAKSNHRNNINDFQKTQAAVHQKTRRYNEQDLGNYQNLDYNQNDKSPTTTSSPTTQKYVQNTFKGYHVEFPPSTTGIDNTSENQNKNIAKGPAYNKDDSPNEYQEVEFQSHVTKPSIKKPQKFKTNPIPSNVHDSKFDSRKNLELPSSEESQIPQESASFLKNSFNSIQETSSYNPFPNHRTTYADIKTIPYMSTKVYSTISSVTPQYITTQPINNGKPFLGSRVGINIKTTKDPLFINPQVMKTKTQLAADDVFKVHVISNSKNVTNSSLVSPKVLEKILFAKIKPLDESTTVVYKGTFESTTEHFSTLEDFSSTTEAISTITTVRPVTSNPQKKQSKTTISRKPFIIQYEDNPEVTYTESRSKTPDYAIIYGSFPSTPLPSNTVQVKFNKTTNKIGIQLGKSFGSGSSKSISGTKSVSQAKPIKIQQSTIKPKEVSQDKSKEEILIRLSSKSIPESLRDNKIQHLNQGKNKGFYVTKTQDLLQSTTQNPTETTLNDMRIYNITIRSTTQQPRPFQRFYYETSTLSTFEDVSKQPNVFDYKISTASPFKSGSPEPTLPTPYRTTTPSIYENIDNMIDVLTEITKEEASSSKSRPGLVVPPSVGPQTLHTLAVYFANALDEVITNKVKNSGKFSEKFMKDNKEKLTTLLTQMTVHGYNQLFNQIQEKNDTFKMNETTINNTKIEDLKLESPQIRQLARNFTIALSAYLNDPEMFRKDLENFRPTEPQSVEIETTTDYNIIDEELLNYSDADTKTSLPPILTTLRPPSPTWGFIIAAKSPNNFEIENSVTNTDLNTADTQSFVPGLNDINNNNAKSKVITKDLPQNHWTTSTSATNLWQSTFSIDPVLFNEEFDSTSPLLYDVETTSAEPDTTTPEILPAIGRTRAVNYELRSLPKFSFNSSEVSGILIDFMNNSSDDSNDRLHRILRKLNTTEDEFLVKMKEIESNPITRRLILLLISECGKNATQDIKHHNEENLESLESLELSETNPLSPSQPQKHTTTKEKNEFQIYVNPNLKEDDQDTRALQLLNTLYSIASKLGK